MANAADLEYLRRQRASAETNKRQGVQAINPNSGGLDALDNKQQGTGNVLLDAGSKVLGTIDELAANFGAGFVGAWEGILDFGATALGALGDATGWYDSKPFTDWAAQDIGTALSEWTKTYANFTPWGIGNMIGQSVERGPEYWEGMWDGFKDIAGSAFFMSTDLKDYREDSDKFYAFNDEMNSGVGQFAKGGARSIGGIVASMIGGNAVAGAISKSAAGAAAASGASKAGIEAAKQAALATKGAQAAVKAGQLGVLGLGAAGKQAEEELNQGTEAGKALATGALSGAVEAGTELIPWPGGNKVGGLLTRQGLSKVSKKAFVKDMIEEGLEEVISATMEPVVKAIGHGDENELKDSKGRIVYTTPDFWLGGDEKGFNESVIGQGVSGAVIGGLMGGVSTFSQIHSLGGTKQYNAVAGYRTVLQQDAAIMEAYADRKITKEEAQYKLEENAKIAKELGEEIAEYSKDEKFRKGFYGKPEMRKKEWKALSEQEKRAYFKDAATPSEYKNYLNEYYSQATKEFMDSLSFDGKTRLNAFMLDVWEDSKAGRAKVYLVPKEELAYQFQAEDGSIQTGYNKAFYNPNNHTIYINEDYSDIITTLLAHEGLVHSILDLNVEERNKLEEKIEKIMPGELSKLDKAIRDSYKEEIARAKDSDELFRSERLAAFIESKIQTFGDLVSIAKGKFNFLKYLRNVYKFGESIKSAKLMIQISNAIRAVDSAKTYNRSMEAELKPVQASKVIGKESEYNETKEGAKSNGRENDSRRVQEGQGLRSERSGRSDGGSLRSEVRSYIDAKAEGYKGSIFKKDNQIAYAHLLLENNGYEVKDYDKAGLKGLKVIPESLYSPEMKDLSKKGEKISVEVVFALNEDFKKFGGEYSNGVAVVYITNPATDIEHTTNHELWHGIVDRLGIDRRWKFTADFMQLSAYNDEAKALYKKYERLYRAEKARLSNIGFKSLVAEEVCAQLFSGAETVSSDNEELNSFVNDLRFWTKQDANKFGNIEVNYRWSKVLNSNEKDSEGNALTNGQVEWARNSKARDGNGNLVVAYHGTHSWNFGFTVFESKHYVGADGTEMEDTMHGGADVNWFTSSRNAAGSYTNAKNFKKMQSIGEAGWELASEAFVNVHNEKIDEFFGPDEHKYQTMQPRVAIEKWLKDMLHIDFDKLPIMKGGKGIGERHIYYLKNGATGEKVFRLSVEQVYIDTTTEKGKLAKQMLDDLQVEYGLDDNESAPHMPIEHRNSIKRMHEALKDAQISTEDAHWNLDKLRNKQIVCYFKYQLIRQRDAYIFSSPLLENSAIFEVGSATEIWVPLYNIIAEEEFMFGDYIGEDSNGQPIYEYNEAPYYIDEQKKFRPSDEEMLEYLERHYGEGKEPIYKIYLNMEDPLIVDAEGAWWSKIKDKNSGKLLKTRDLVNRALKQGKDGLIIKNVLDYGPNKNVENADYSKPIDVYVTLKSPNQIKLTTNLDPTDSQDIRYSKDLSAVELDRIVPEPETNDSGKITEIYVPVIDNMSGKFKKWNTEKVAKDLGDGFVVVENVPKPAKGEAPVEKKDTSNYKIMDSHTGRIVEHMDPTYNRMVGFAKRDITLKDFVALFTKEERQQALKAREKLLSNPDADSFASRYWKEYAETVKQTKKKAQAKPKEVAPSKPGLVVGKPTDSTKAKAYEQPKQEAKVEEKLAPKEEPKPAEEKKAKPKKVEAEPVEQEKPDSNLVNLQSVLKEQGLEFNPENQNMMQFATPFVDEKNTTYKRVIFKQPLFDSVGPVYGIVREGNEVIRDEKVWEKASKKKVLKQESPTEAKPVEKPKLNPKPSTEPVEIANRQERTPKPKTDAKYTLKTGEFHNYNAPKELKEGNTDESKSKYGIVLFINPITDTIGTVYGYDGITANNIRPHEEWVNFIENGLNKNDVNFIQDEERIKKQNKELYETIKDDTRALAEAIVDLSPTKFLTIETAQALMQQRKKEAAEKLAKANESSKKVKGKEAEKKPAEKPKKTEKKATTPKVEKPAEPAKEPVKEAKPVKETKATKEAKPAKEIKKETEKPKELPKKDGVTDLSSVAGLTVGRPVESKPEEEKKPTKKKVEKKVAEKPKEEAPKEAPKEEAKKEVKEKPKKEPKPKPETKVIVKEVEKPGSMPKEEVDRILSTIELEREERVEVESKLRENIVELRALPPLAQKLTVAHLNADVISGTILEVPSSAEALVGNEYRAAMVPFAKAGIMADGKLQLKVFVPAIRSLADMYTEENFGAMYDPAINMVLDNIYLWTDSGSATSLQEKQAFALFKAIKSLGSKRFRQVELNRIRQAAEADYGLESLGKYEDQAPLLRTAEKIVSMVSDPRATTEMMFSSLTNVGDKLINDASKQAGFSRAYEFDAEMRIQKIQQDFGLDKERAGVEVKGYTMPYLAALEWRLMLSMPEDSKEFKNAQRGYTYHDTKTDHDVTVSYDDSVKVALEGAIPDSEFVKIRKAIVDDFYGEFIYDKIAEIYKRNTNLDLGELMPKGQYIRLTTARLRTSLLAGKVVGAPSTSNLKQRNTASAPIRMGQGLFAKMREVANMTAYEYYMQPLLAEVDHIFNTLQISGKDTILKKLGITKQQFLKWYVDALSGAAKPEATGAFGQAMVQMTLANFKIAPIQMLSAFTSGLSVTEQFNPVLLKNAFKPDAKHQKALDNLFEVLPEARNRGARNEVYAGNVGETKATIFSRYMRKIGEFVSKYTGTNMTDKATIRYILLAALNTTAKEMGKSIDDVEVAKATEQRARTLYMTQISSDTKFMSPAQHVSNPYGNTTGTQKVAMRMVKAFGGAAKAFTNFFNRTIVKLLQMRQAEKWLQNHSLAEYDNAIAELNTDLENANKDLITLQEELERAIKERDEKRDAREKGVTATKKWKKAIKYLHKLEGQLAEAKKQRNNKAEVARLTEQLEQQKKKVEGLKSGFTVASQSEYEDAKSHVDDIKGAITAKKSSIHLLENKIATQEGYKAFFTKTQEAVIAWKRDKEATKLLMNLIFGMLLAGLGKTFIDEIYNLIFRRKDIQEVFTTSLAGEVALNSTVNLYPGLRTIAGIFQGNEASDPTIKTFNLISDSIQSVTAFGKNQSEGNRKALLRNAVQLISLISGVPFKTVYDQVNGLIGWFNPEAALEMKNVFYQMSNTASGKFNTAIENKKTSEAISYLGYLSNERVGNMTDSLKQEIVRLNEAGESFVPSELPSSYKDENGKEVTLSWSQKQQAKMFYSKANYMAAKAISRADYKKLSDASKAYALKTIYAAYRNASLVNGARIASNSLTKYGLIASTNSPIVPQIFIALAAIKALSGDKSNSRKEQAIKLVNSLALDKNQKALVLYLAGYKVDDSYVKAALRNMGANMSEITQLLS